MQATRMAEPIRALINLPFGTVLCMRRKEGLHMMIAWVKYRGEMGLRGDSDCRSRCSEMTKTGHAWG